MNSVHDLLTRDPECVGMLLELGGNVRLRDRIQRVDLERVPVGQFCELPLVEDDPVRVPSAKTWIACTVFEAEFHVATAVGHRVVERLERRIRQPVVRVEPMIVVDFGRALDPILDAWCRAGTGAPSPRGFFLRDGVGDPPDQKPDEQQRKHADSIPRFPLVIAEGS